MGSCGEMTEQQSIQPAKRRLPGRWVRLSVRHLLWPPPAALTLLLVLGALAASPQSVAAQGGQVGEYELKAAILFNLARFVEWPAAAYADSQAPTILCVLGRDPFGSSLTTVIPKEGVNGRPLLVRYFRSEKAIRDCHVLYISSSERKTLAQVFSTLKGSSVLTVGEMTQFAVQGGIVQFNLQDKQVRFEINLDAATRVGLKISSRLLVLARIVSDRNHDSASRASPSPSQSSRTLVSPGPLPGAREGLVSGKTVRCGLGAASGEDCDGHPGSQRK